MVKTEKQNTINIFPSIDDMQCMLDQSFGPNCRGKPAEMTEERKIFDMEETKEEQS